MAQARPIYLDYAAATPLDTEVMTAMQPFYTENFYNPSATYMAAIKIGQILEAARASVAHWLGARIPEIVFTAGGTEANNVAIHGVMQQYPEGNCVVSMVEHESVLAPAEQYQHNLAPVLADGRVAVNQLHQLIDDNTVLVSIMYANNEIGTVQPLREIGQLIKRIRDQRRKVGNNMPIYLHSDACQAASYLDLQTARLGVDLLTLNGGKIYGPKQSGILYVKAGTILSPFIVGGGQEHGLRSGTENIAQAVGFAKALDIAQTIRHQEAKRLHDLQHYFYKALGQKMPQATVNGSQKFRIPNNIHITIPGTDNERVLISLDEQGIMAAAGSACSASDEEPSHVLRAIGLSNSEARSSLRLTMGRATTVAELKQLIKVLLEIIEF
jgi:cysteine desulfurase